MTKQTTKKKNLTWKLKELPSASELADLVDSGVITVDEAREIVFGNPETDKDKIQALEEINEFLRDLVKELSKNKNTTTFVPYTRTIEYTPRPYWDKVWMQTTESLKDSGFNLTTTGTGTVSYGSVTNGVYEGGSRSVMSLSVSPAQEGPKIS